MNWCWSYYCWASSASLTVWFITHVWVWWAVCAPFWRIFCSAWTPFSATKVRAQGKFGWSFDWWCRSSPLESFVFCACYWCSYWNVCEWCSSSLDRPTATPPNGLSPLICGKYDGSTSPDHRSVFPWLLACSYESSWGITAVFCLPRGCWEGSGNCEFCSSFPDEFGRTAAPCRCQLFCFYAAD